MASPSNSVYFPALDACLKGEKDLLSWNLVASTIEDLSNDCLLSDAVSDFLHDSYVHGLIKSPSRAFDQPSSQTKSEFETKTAAINVPPTSNAKYDIKTIKEDALWLSKNANISEIAALRIVVIEFQSRPQRHLCGSLSAQDVINLQQAVGADGTQANSLLAYVNATETTDAEKLWTIFNTEAGRRQRLVDVYLSERRYFMSFIDSILKFTLEQVSLALPKREALQRQMLESIFGEGKDIGSLITRDFDELVSNYLGLLPKCMGRAEDGPKDILQNAILELDWVRTALTETLHLMASIFQLIDCCPAFISAENVSAWFEFVDAYGFMDRLAGVDDQAAEVLQPIKHITCVISMRLLNLPRSIGFLDEKLALGINEDSYLTSDKVLKQIHETIFNAANAGLITAGPVIFSWTLILQRMLQSHHERQEKRDLQQNRQAQEGFEREIQNVEARPGIGRRSSAGSIVSMESQTYDGFLTAEFGSSQQQQDLQHIEQVAMAVTAGGQMHDFLTEMVLTLGEGRNAAFRPDLGSSMRLVLLEFLKFSFPVVGYISESITTLLAVLSASHGYWEIHSKKTSTRGVDVIGVALEDILIRQFYIMPALQRYPHEFVPFTSLCRILSTSLEGDHKDLVKNALIKTPTLTFTLPSSFFQFTEDDEELGKLELVEDFPLFSVSPARKRLAAEDEPFCIPAGTHGQLASDAGQIVLLHYEHSTLALLGKRLEANLTSDSYDLALGPLDKDDLAEAVLLLATLIRCEDIKAGLNKSGLNSGDESGLAILREASRALPRTKDIVTVVCDTLDSYIDGDLTNPDVSSIRVMTACLQFLESILPFCLGRVWSYMARCDLLVSATRPGRLSRITGTLDLVDDHFDLLSTVVKFFGSLIDSSMTGAVQRKVGLKTSSRGAENDSIWQGGSDKNLVQVVLSIAHTSIDILENSLTWRFSSEVHRSILLGGLIPILDRIVSCSLVIGDETAADSPTRFLKPAANYIIDGFLSSASSSLRFQSFLSSMLVALGMPESTLYQRRADIISCRQLAVLQFATTLIRVANFQERPVTAIEGQLLKCSSLLARLCAADSKYKDSTLSLFGALAERISREDSEVPSLLGYLGPHVSRSFLQTISRLDRPFDRPEKSAKAWEFFSTIMRNGQHWMANCLLTGKSPRDALGSGGTLSKLAPDSILKTALARLRLIRILPASETLAILDLLTSAHNYWQWTIFASQEDEGCLAELRAYVRELKSASVTVKVSPSQACDEARIAAYIAEAFAMHLYHLRKTGREKEFAQELVNDIDYYLRDGVTVSGYNKSLHANFAKNFSNQYPGFSLENFQRALLVPRELGENYYYALDIADTMLKFDPGWSGPRENKGFRAEMVAANYNLSLVDAQIALFHAWESLLLELSSCLLPKEQLITKQMMQVAQQCLACNQANQGPERIFQRITQSRANLAMVLIQRLTDSTLPFKDVTELLVIVWSTVNSIENPFSPEQIQYWRTMLRMLYVVLRGYRPSPKIVAHRADEDINVEVTQCVLNILDRVVAQGFRSLVALIHDAELSVLPEDLALITAILQACLCLPGMDQLSSQVLNIMVCEDVGQAAISLYSWADKLAVRGDPLYGELSILFLLQLSNVPALAEHLASDGLLAQLTSTNITSHIQRPNVSPFAESTGAQRCYDIWAKGILPLLLNVLSTPGLGPNIATEVAYVLNQFPSLLKSSVDRIEAPGMSRTSGRGAPHYIALLGVTEINSLAIITQVLNNYRANLNREIPEVVWDSATVLENVDYWLSARTVLRERLMPLGQRESDWRNMKSSVEGVSILEDKVVSLLEAVREVLGEEQE